MPSPRLVLLQGHFVTVAVVSPRHKWSKYLFFIFNSVGSCRFFCFYLGIIREIFYSAFVAGVLLRLRRNFPWQKWIFVGKKPEMFRFYSWRWAQLAYFIGKMSPFRPQLPQFEPWLCQDLNIGATSFLANITQPSILPGCDRLVFCRGRIKDSHPLNTTKTGD